MVNSKVNVYTVPCLSDNYAYVIHNSATGNAAIVDIPDSGPIISKIAELGATVTDVFLTHHHWDHIDGLADLQTALSIELGQAQCRVVGAKADVHRLPPLDEALIHGQTVQLCGLKGKVFDVSGHTLGHLALHIPDIKALFTADSLMAMGCGRLFEGTPDQMWQSLSQLRVLPSDTLVYSGHEYTANNMAFALSLGEKNLAIATRATEITACRAAGHCTVPSLLSLELKTNPFLRADDPALQASIGMSGNKPTEIFSKIRELKDNF